MLKSASDTNKNDETISNKNLNENNGATNQYTNVSSQMKKNVHPSTQSESNEKATNGNRLYDADKPLEVKIPEESKDHSEELKVWAGSHKKSLKERQNAVKTVFPKLDISVLNGGGLNKQRADIMVENCIGTIGMPIGMSPNFVINGNLTVVPMCIEEPSVIAACTSISKLIAKYGGFYANSTGNVMTGQVQLLDIADLEEALKKLNMKKQDIISNANMFCSSMVDRGGGVIDVCSRIVRPRTLNGRKYNQKGCIVAHIHIDVCESMGANVVNTVAEGIAPYLANIVDGRAALRILTNYCIMRRARSTFQIPLDGMAQKGTSGTDVAERIVEAYHFALDDPFRAATNNKGIMNGIDAVALATGQDQRALESASHAYASRYGYYGPLAHYKISGDKFIGSLELPISVGSQGGAVKTHPTYNLSHNMLGNPCSKVLSQIIASVGLAQNFAALRALVIEGIQKGHMALHSRNIAAAANVPIDMINEVAGYMSSRNMITKEAAKEYMDARFMQTQTPKLEKPMMVLPSILFVQIDAKSAKLDNPLSLNILFPSYNFDRVQMSIVDTVPLHPFHEALFGNDKDAKWLAEVFCVIDQIKLSHRARSRFNTQLQARLKLISILLNLIANQLVLSHPHETTAFLKLIVRDKSRSECLSQIKNSERIIRIGFTLILELYFMFNQQVEEIKHSQKNLTKELLKEQQRIIISIYDRPILHTQLEHVKKTNGDNKQRSARIQVETFMKIHCKRQQATMFLLCDALSISPGILNEERLNFILQLGEHFEYEGTVSHDISRYFRDRRDQNPNVLVLQLKAMNYQPSRRAIREFLHLFDDIYLKKRVSILASEQPDHFFDIGLFMKNLAYIRDHYKISSFYTKDNNEGNSSTINKTISKTITSKM